MTILDRWLWPEKADGMPITVDVTLTLATTQEYKAELAKELLESHEDAVRVVEWQQHDTYPGFAEGPVNVEVQRWERVYSLL